MSLFRIKIADGTYAHLFMNVIAGDKKHRAFALKDERDSLVKLGYNREIIPEMPNVVPLGQSVIDHKVVDTIEMGTSIAGKVRMNVWQGVFIEPVWAARVARQAAVDSAVGNKRALIRAKRAQKAFEDAVVGLPDEFPFNWYASDGNDIFTNCPESLSVFKQPVPTFVNSAMTYGVTYSNEKVDVSDIIVDCVSLRNVLDKVLTPTTVDFSTFDASTVTDVALLMNLIRGVYDEQITAKEYLDGVVTFMHILLQNEALDSVKLSPYDVTHSLGTAVSKMANVSLTSDERRLLDVAIPARYGVQSELDEQPYDDASSADWLFDKLLDVAVTSADGFTYVTFERNGKRYSGRYQGVIPQDRVKRTRTAFHTAVANAYKAAFGTDAPHALRWCGLGQITFKPYLVFGGAR